MVTKAKIQTNHGTIVCQLFEMLAPKTCENFKKLIQAEYYNGVIFHRVIEGFMIQGGDPTGTGRGGKSIWGEAFEDELTKELTFHKPYVLAMANAGPNTNGSQFFITTAPAPWLDMHHTIFGEVVQGEDVVKKIEKTATDQNDRPLKEQKIITTSIYKE